MSYELDGLDRALLQKCRDAVRSSDMQSLDEDDYREAVELLVALTDETSTLPVWPHRCNYLPDLGYVVWRDVFEGQMRCSLENAIRTHKTAVFVTGSEAEDYRRYRNEMAWRPE